MSPGADLLGLERISRLLAALGHPERKLPPVFHVAGTNGKGSTCAFLRAAIEAQGRSAHVYTSPHLVRFNERIRIAGRLIGDDELAALLMEVLDRAGEAKISFFEATTAAALLAFSRLPADACIIEVGLGGRLDATNIVPAPAVCGIAQLGVDHQDFLGAGAEDIAAEKAGIAKAGVPLVTLAYPAPIAARIAAVAEAAGATWLPLGGAWEVAVLDDGIGFRDAEGEFKLPHPALAGAHQAMNAALAVAMLRHQHRLRVEQMACREAMRTARWPARLQRLADGPLARLLPEGSELWLDGAHNPAAVSAISGFFAGSEFDIVMGLLANKDAPGMLAAFAGHAVRFHFVPIAGHDHHRPETLAAMAADLGFPARAAASAEDALRQISAPGRVLIMGSLYLAGEVLAANGEAPE